MARIPHGGHITLEKAREAASRSPIDLLALGIPLGAVEPDFNAFGFMFKDLQLDDDNLLPESPTTVENLKRLGVAMIDTDPTSTSDSNIPAAYTYLGQFIDHDITFELVSGTLGRLDDPDLAPLSRAEIAAKIRNTRTAMFDLDSVYEGLAERHEEKMALGVVSKLNNPNPPEARPEGKDDNNDVPRKGRINVDELDREALIGDPRNDENTIVSQLHLAFLRAHNAIVDQGNDFEEARRLLRRHYQWMVVHDFLKRIADPDIVDATIQNNAHYNPENEDFFMPLEFSVAAYRFGHSMIRGAYNFNRNFNLSGLPGTFQASLGLLFAFSSLSGQLGGHPTLPENWIIEWERLVDLGGNFFDKTRRLDTNLVVPLSHLTGFDGNELPEVFKVLAARNLLRGYQLRIPTGQAVASALGLIPLTATEILATVSADQQAVLTDSGFDSKTPLWYYVLAEAAAAGGGNRLGPVGSTLVAETIVGLIRRSEDSIFDGSGFTPTLGTSPGQFDLPELLRLGSVLQ